jgi:hypothetical protein
LSLFVFQPPAKPSSASVRKELGDRQSSFDEFKKIDKRDIKIGKLAIQNKIFLEF